MDLLLIVACLYMAYINITSLAETPLSEWGLVQYVMVVLTVLLVAVGGLKGWQYYKKKTAPPPKEEAEDEQPALEESPAPEEPAAPEAAAIEAAQPEEPAPPPLPVEEDVDETALEDWEIEAADFHYTLVELPEDEK